MFDWNDLLRILGDSVILLLVLRYLAMPYLLEKLRRSFSSDLEKLRHELSLARVAYEQHLELLLDYYNRVFRHWRLCQEAASVDIKVAPEGTGRFPKREFLDRHEEFRKAWGEDEGKIRLILPAALLEKHLALIQKINNFVKAIKNYLEAERNEWGPEEVERRKEPIRAAFQELESLRESMQTQLRVFLRTEEILAGE